MPSTRSPVRWAVVVGIDHYSSDPRFNLSGCVNDATMVLEFLRTSLPIPAANIKLMLAGSPRRQIPVPYSSPTKDNFVTALTEINKCAAQGDFLLVYFAGHGRHAPTVFSHLKPNTHDQMLCFVNNQALRDVELGTILDTLAKKLTVVAILDSCFSGGADRDDQQSDQHVRAMPDGYCTSQPADVSQFFLLHSMNYVHQTYTLASMSQYRRHSQYLTTSSQSSLQNGTVMESYPEIGSTISADIT